MFVFVLVQCKKLAAAAVPEVMEDVSDELAAAAVPEEVEDVSDEDEAAEMPDEQVKEEVEKSKQTKELKQKLAQELSDCVVICQSVSFKSFKQAKEKCLWSCLCLLIFLFIPSFRTIYVNQIMLQEGRCSLGVRFG